MKVLVVEDDGDQRRLRALLLERSGFEALEASDRASAGKIAAEQGPAAAVLDLSLPSVKEGVELIRELKALNPEIHLIVVTGRNPAAIQRSPEARLIDHLFVKPLSTPRLIRALQAYA
jgi:CheY-like chemotaxis protein